MCQIRQNSVNDLLRYGLSKFWGKFIPRIVDAPSAISTYPLKSKYICNGKSRKHFIMLSGLVSELAKKGSI